MSTMKAFVTRHPVATYFALSCVSITASLLILNPFAISGVARLTYSFALAAMVWVVVAAVAVANRAQLSRQPLRTRAA